MPGVRQRATPAIRTCLPSSWLHESRHGIRPVPFLLALFMLASTQAAATRHVPGMSLTAEIFAESAPVPQVTAPTERAPVDSAEARGPLTVAANTPGVITGYVRDVESGKGLPYTNIIVYRQREGRAPEQEMGSIALNGGQYFARVNPGTFEVRFLYLGYENFVAEDVVVEPGSTVSLDASMKVKPIEFEALTIQAQKITNTAAAALATKKREVAVTESITAEEISKGTDSDAAEALERVTGLSVVGGKFVFVRGLGDRYSSTTLNGAPLSSPEPGRETVPLDIFPAAMLDNIVVQKAYTPDMDGNFGGGNIDVRTRRGIEELTFTQKLSYGFNQSVLDEDFYTYDGGATDLLAMDDGTRSLERVLPRFAKRYVNPITTSKGEQVAATFRAKNVWTPRRVQGPPNFGYSGLLSDGFQIGERRGSYVGALSYSHSAKTELQNVWFRRIREEPLAPEQEVRRTGSERAVLIGATGALTFQPTDRSNVQYNLLYTRAAEDQARSAYGKRDGETDPFIGHTLKYVERSLLTHVLRGSTNLGRPNSEISWLLSSSSAERFEPDSRFSRLQIRPLGRGEDENGLAYSSEGIGIGDGQGSNIVRLWGETEETSRTAQVDFSVAFPELEWIKRTLRTGFSYRDRERAEEYRRFPVGIPNNAIGLLEDAYGIEGAINQQYYEQFAPTNPAAYVTRENTSPYDGYSAERKTIAAYGMFDVDFFETVRLSAGGRYETSTQTASSLSLVGESQGLEPILANASTDDWFPAANVTWRISDKLQTRLAYSETSNRPQLRELSAVRVFDYELDEVTSGNPFVDPAQVQALDARLEFFPAPRSYAAISAFDKTIDKAIVTAASGFENGRAIFPANAEDGGLLRGWEVEWRGPIADIATGGHQAAVSGSWLLTRPLWLFGKIPGLASLGTWAPDHRWITPYEAPALANWGFTFNYSSITSEIPVRAGDLENQYLFVVGPDGEPLRDPDAEERIIRLTGQADSALNVGLYYGNGRQDFSVLVKDFGLQLTSATDRTFYDPPVVVDSAFSTKLGEHVKLKLSVEDIFPGDRIERYASNPYLPDPNSDRTSLIYRFSETVGRKYGASLTYDF